MEEGGHGEAFSETWVIFGTLGKGLTTNNYYSRPFYIKLWLSQQYNGLIMIRSIVLSFLVHDPRKHEIQNNNNLLKENYHIHKK